MTEAEYRKGILDYARVYVQIPRFYEWMKAAPSDRVREVKILEQCSDTMMTEEEFTRRRRALWKEFTDEDWDYTIKTAGHNQGRYQLKKIREEIQGNKRS